MNTNSWSRNCSTCGKELFYTSKISYRAAIRKNSTCYTCRPKHWLGRKHSDETKLKIGQANSGKEYCKSNLNKKFSEDHRKKISEANLGNKSRTGMPHSPETKIKMSAWQKGKPKSEEFCKKMSESRKGRGPSKETWEKIMRNLPRGENHHNKRPENRARQRRIQLARLEKCKGQLSPFYNSKACQLFDEINKELGWKGKHAENGGETRILNYWLDFYEPNLNIAIEYDEPYHNTIKQKEKDVRKEREIIAEFKCKFYRIKETDDWRKVLCEYV